jgi:hypothetical protein
LILILSLKLFSQKSAYEQEPTLLRAGCDYSFLFCEELKMGEIIAVSAAVSISMHDS